VDPKFAAAYAMLSWTHVIDALGMSGTSSSPRDSLERAFRLAQEAIALDDSLPDGHMALAFVYLARKQHAEAVPAGSGGNPVRRGGTWRAGGGRTRWGCAGEGVYVASPSSGARRLASSTEA
jgi:hypothetical protein